MSPELIMWRMAVGRAWAESATGVTCSANDARIRSRPVGHSTNIQLSRSSISRHKICLRPKPSPARMVASRKRTRLLDLAFHMCNRYLSSNRFRTLQQSFVTKVEFGRAGMGRMEKGWAPMGKAAHVG
jgi:hypothetical protein